MKRSTHIVRRIRPVHLRKNHHHHLCRDEGLATERKERVDRPDARSFRRSKVNRPRSLSRSSQRTSTVTRGSSVTSTGTTSGPRVGEVDSESSLVELLLVHTGDGGVGLLLSGEGLKTTRICVSQIPRYVKNSKGQNTDRDPARRGRQRKEHIRRNRNLGIDQSLGPS